MSFGELAELAAERRLLVGGQVLVAEEDDVVGVERLPDRGHRRVVERPGQVDAAISAPMSGDSGRTSSSVAPVMAISPSVTQPVGRPEPGPDRPGPPVPCGGLAT